MGLSSGGETVVGAALLTGRYVSLHTADPGNTGTSEISTSGSAYVRQAASFVDTGDNPSVFSNNAIIQFPVATSNWGTLTHFGVWSAASGGTFLGSGTLTVSKAIAIDDIARFPVGTLTVTVD